MKKITVIQEMDLDEETIGVTDENKVQSMFILTDQELTVPANVIQQFIFRKAKNSNYMMFCTGFLYNNEWYGDRPDDGVFKDPFQNKDFERKGDLVTEYVKPTEPKRSALIFEETWQGVKVRAANLMGKFDETSMPMLENVTYNGNNLGITSWDVDGSEYVYTSSVTAVNSQSDAKVEFDLDGKHYVGTLPKIADNGGLGTFAVYGSGENDWDGVLAHFTVANAVTEKPRVATTLSLVEENGHLKLETTDVDMLSKDTVVRGSLSYSYFDSPKSRELKTETLTAEQIQAFLRGESQDVSSLVTPRDEIMISYGADTTGVEIETPSKIYTFYVRASMRLNRLPDQL